MIDDGPLSNRAPDPAPEPDPAAGDRRDNAADRSPSSDVAGFEVLPLVSLHSISTPCEAPRGVILGRDGTPYVRTCGRLTCPHCLAWKARQYVRHVIAAAATHELTMTLVGSSGPEVRKGMSKFVRRIRSRNPGVGMVWLFEWNESMAHAHVHAAVRGLSDRSSLGDAVGTSRFGERFTFERIRTTLDSYARYMTKVPRHAADGEEQWAAAQSFMEINGGRLRHATQGFWVPPSSS